MGNQGPKNMSSNVCRRLKFVKISRKDLLCTKMQKKASIDNLIEQLKIKQERS